MHTLLKSVHPKMKKNILWFTLNLKQSGANIY